MTVDRLDQQLQRFLEAEARRADAYGSMDEMVAALTRSAGQRALFPSRALLLALVALGLLVALMLSFALSGGRLNLVRSIQGPGNIVYAKSGAMHIYDADGGVDRVIYRQDWIEGQAELWSEDGSRIVFDAYFATSVAGDGTDVVVVPGTRYGMWSPDAKRYAANRGDKIEIEDTSGAVVQTLDLPAGMSGVDSLEWSRDGRRIAVTVFTCTSAATCDDRQNGYLPPDPSPDDFSELWIVPLDGQAPYRLIDPVDQTTQVELNPYIQGGNWSPDDSVLALTGPASCQDGLCVLSTLLIDSTTGEVRGRIPNAGFQGWSADGTWLAFNASTSPTTSSIGVIHPDGSGRTELVASAVLPVFSADGQRLAYFLGAESEIGEVHIINIDGTDDHVAFSGTNNFDWQHFAP